MLPLVAEPARYVAGTWDLKAEPARRKYWIDLFRAHFPRLIRQAMRDMGEEPQLEARLNAARDAFFAWLDRAERHPERCEVLDILEICKERERVLREQGIDDPYRLAKQRENDKALIVLPRLLAELDALPDDERVQAITEGIFAGNIFDLGATDTEKLFRDGAGIGFHAVRQQLKLRPWRVDDYDAWAACFMRGYRCALLFVDNAGSDIVLGMLPLARELLRRGTRVILTANSEPSLNDITHEELIVLLDRVDVFDDVLREARAQGRMLTVASGNWLPLIDMGCVSCALAEMVRRHPVDLLVIEGMGRALESNWHVRFKCDTLKIAMVKDAGVAEALGGALYDLVLRFQNHQGHQGHEERQEGK